MKVGQRFDALLANIKLTEDQKTDGETKHCGVRNCLNKWYYSLNSDYSNSMLVGSWAKETRIRPPRDVDVLFVLPDSTYQRFQQRSGNKQSQLLQEVKSVLAAKYLNTNIRGDGPVVLIPFTSYNVELVPGFKLTGGQYWIPITSGGGTYKIFDPEAEVKRIRDADNAAGANVRPLIRMMKRWQEHCSVPIKSFWLELLAADFLQSWKYRNMGTMFYDFLVRDFLTHLVGKANSYVLVPGTYEILNLGDSWRSRAETARDRAKKACDFEAADQPYSAGSEWQKIFGTYIPTG